MSEIDSRILTKSVAYMRELEDQGLIPPRLSVNVSYARLTDPNLRRPIERLPGAATKLVFEIVEAVLLDDRNDLTSWELDAIRERGIGIELDDFGTGHAPVVGLTQRRPDRMKGDKKFIISLPDRSCEDLLRTIVGIGRAMKIPLTAEGVETEAQAQILRALGVDTLQGYLFGKACRFPEPRTALQNRAA
ncbi:EAL domain-containing protein [Ovoidimarina sediminis]|uniref:EAL domain-containing protein n=1 Tax=Ovoidimarina sediminis TaxID=3079856 RepID=UPI00290A873D|nr:EAL domain-containing protein [Rhodophyticola sp. MJ-SS7]MDU8941794.1 EAL domain-containing protein [Rhodophyticola sp. MJ-SS7]